MKGPDDPLLVAFDRFVTVVDWSDPKITFVEAFTEAVADWMAQRAAEAATEVPWRNESDEAHLFDAVQDLNEFLNTTNDENPAQPTTREGALAEALIDWTRTNEPDGS